MALVMYAGELQDRLELSHFGFRASEVRHSISCLFYTNDRATRFDQGMREAWARARKEGWKVVPVIVEDRRVWLNRERLL